jgi:hypothetical protein
MGTRALIGYLDTDQSPAKLTATYNHYDGYPENLGKGLELFYNNDAKAEEIANVGYISYLDPETGKWDAVNQQIPEVTMLPDNFNEAMMEIAVEVDSFGADYGYIWDNENEEWIAIKNNGIRSMAEELEMNLAHLKDKFAMMPERPDQTMEAYHIGNDKEVIGNKEDTISKAKKALKGKMNLDIYIKSLENDIRLNGKESYEDYSVEDFVEDYDNYTQDKVELDEAFVRQMKYKAGIIK